MEPRLFLKYLNDDYQEHANLLNAEWMAKYLKNQFSFYGIKTPERKLLSKQAIENYGFFTGEDLKKLLLACFEADKREVQYFVQDAMRPRLKKLDVSFLETFEALIPMKSWWDTVDFLAPKLLGGLLLRFPDQLSPLVYKWIQSDNFWFQRTAILVQLHYKTKTDKELLKFCILEGRKSKEFFVQKAIGWALREYSKTDAEWVIDFIQEYQLAPLSAREGLKWLKNKRPELF